MTAYVASGLRLAAGAGYSVDQQKLSLASQALALRFDSDRRAAPDTRAYALYAMALLGQPASARLEAVWDQRASLTSLGWALLGLTLDRLKDQRAGEAAAHLSSTALQQGEEAWWDSNRDPMLDFESDNSLEATAFAIKLLARNQPASPLIDKAAQWLVNHRDQGYYWSSTKRTAFVIFGLTDVLKRSGELKPDFSARVLFNGKQVLEKRFGAADALSPAPVSVTVPLAADAVPRIQVEKSGAGRLYASVNWQWRAIGTTEERSRPAGSPLRINRNYSRLSPVTAAGRVTWRMDPLEGDAKPGDLIAVRLSISGGDQQRYFVVEDPLPSGAEVVPDDSLYELRGRPVWWRTWWERREIRDSRVTFFPWMVPRDGLEYVYLFKLTNAGSLRVAPARIEPMYTPGRLSWSEPKPLEVRP
ncbi:MAG: hypothetical protein HZB13_20625 [Acidobacteria bacterium]|nr:hypothetical protein [Acidobacteriota bacterium]